MSVPLVSAAIRKRASPNRTGRRVPGRVGNALVGVAALVAALVAVVVVWAIAAAAFDDPNVLPTPTAVADRFGDLLGGGNPSLVENALVSLRRVLLGWGAGCLAGVVVGAAMASSRWTRGILDPLIELGRPIPPLAFVPLLVIWFGIGELPKILVLMFGSFPIVTISTVAAIRGVDVNWRRAAETLGASRAYVLRHVTIPAALPGILVSVRLANGLCWSALVAAEIIASTEGLGWMILQAGRFLDTATIFVGIITIGALAFAMDRLLRLAEGVLVPWHGKG